MSPIDRAMLERMALKATKVPDGTSCPRCGYELAGLDPMALCPECGSRIELALKPDYLNYCAPEYVARLHTGAFLVVLGMVLAILTFLLKMFFGVVGGMGGGVGGGMGGMLLLAPMMRFAIGILSLVGWWLLSSPDPGESSVDPGASSRQILRVLLSILAATSTFNLVVILTGMSFTAMPIIEIVTGLEQLASYAAFAASMLYLRTLAYRMQSQHIADRAKTLLWLAVALFVVAVIVFGGAMLTASAGGGIGGGMGGGMVIFGCLALPMGVLGLVFFLMYLFLLDQTRRTLKEIRQRM